MLGTTLQEVFLDYLQFMIFYNLGSNIEVSLPPCFYFLEPQLVTQ